MTKTIKIEYPPLLEATFNEGAFKSALKRLNPILDHAEECKTIRDFIISELKANVANSAILLGINNSLSLFKIAFEHHATVSKGAVATVSNGVAATVWIGGATAVSDLFFLHILQPILPEILSYWNFHILSYCHLAADELLDVADSPATSSHQLTCLIHKAARICLSLLNRMMDADQRFPSLKYSLMALETSFEGLMNGVKVEFPLDVKCNLALGICYIFKIIDDQRLHREMSTIFSPCSFVGDNPVNQLAFAFGLLNVSSTDESVDASFESRMLLIGQFLFTLDHGSKEALNLGTGRVLEMWMEKLVQSGLITEGSRRPLLEALFPDIEFFVFSYLPGHIDAVKSCCRNVLRNLTRIYDRMEPCDVWTKVKGLIERILTKPEHIKWMALWCVTGSTRKALSILQIDPKASQTLLSSERTMKNPASEVYLTLMFHHFPEVGLEEWESTWIEPLFSTQRQLGKNETNWPQKRSIIASILKTGQKRIVELVMDYVLRKMKSASASSEDACTESSLLTVEAIKLATELKVDMKQTVGGEDAENYFRGLVPRQILHAWATSSRIQIRLACFSLLVETKKTTEVIPRADLESLKFLFKYNIVSQNAAFRQQFFAYYKKLMKRFRDSLNVLVRNRDVENLANYDNFFAWLWNFLTTEEGLFPGANFGRRCQTLEFMSQLLEKFDAETLKIALPSNEDVSYLRWMYDTYEYNKKLVFPVLLKLYTKPLEEGNLGQKLLEEAFRLCESVYPPDSVTGRYLALFLIQHRYNGLPWMSVPELLEKILEKLEKLLEAVRETSLIEVTSRTQMYGYLQLLRSLFTEDPTISASPDLSIYRSLALQILKLCYAINEILLPVLGDAAPEGFLPGLPDSEPGNSHVVRSIHAQRLLVCSWRSMRDICMLLSEMVALFPAEGEHIHFVLTFEEVRRIGDHLLFLLKNVMHRGVFEQVFTGFKHLAYRLFKSTSGKLNDLPVKWLSEAFDQELISNKCFTRRSAGLPFIFQALLSPMCLNEPFIAKYVDRIFETYFTAAGDSNYIRIHCTNVLRALFKDANFSRVMMPYVPKGLKLVFRQLESSNWNESNAGLMLYGAIIRRTFGPELNLMTAPTFFRRFPEMYDFLLELVKKCAENVIADLEAPQYRAADDFTYQVLILLSSFAVNGVVEYGPLKISEFISPIRTCALSSDYQVREVAAKALSPFLIKSSCKIEYILTILNEYAQRHLKKKANVIHGDFLQILQLLKSIPEEDSKERLIEAFNTTFTSDNLLWTCPCPTVYESLAEICVHLGQPLDPVLRTLQNSYSVTFDRLPSDQRWSFPGMANADAVLARARTQFALYEQNPEAIIYEWIVQKPNEFLVQVFSVLSTVKFFTVPSAAEPTSALMAVFDAAMKRYLKQQFEFSAQTEEEEAYLDFLAGADESIYGRWSEISENENLVQHLLKCVFEIAEMETGTVSCKESGVIVLGKLAFSTQMPLTSIQSQALCSLWSSLCDPSCDVDLRLAVAKSLPMLPFSKFPKFTVLEQCKFWYSVLTLMLDDEGSVRDEINSKIGNGAESGEGKSQFCERKSAEVILGSFLTEFASKYPIEGLTVIVGLILRDDFEISVSGTDDCEEEHLFDRSEMNAYAEPLLLAKILREHLSVMPDLKASFRHHYVKTQLTSDLITMYRFVANVNGPSEGDMSTLRAVATSCLPNRDPGRNSLGNVSEASQVQLHTYEFLSSLLEA